MGKKIKSLFATCAESVQCCDKAQYNEATIWEKVRIHIHIAICKPCYNYTSKNVKLSKLIRRSNIKTCTEQEKEVWQKQILNEINK